MADNPQPDADVLGQSFTDWLRSRFAWLFGSQPQGDPTRLGTVFVYHDGPDLLGEYGTGGNKSTGSTEYIWLPTPGGNHLVGAIVRGEIHAVHSDHLNTPRLMTDAQNQPVWQWAYSAFGDNEPSVAARNFRDRSWAFANGELRDLADGSDDADNGPQFGRKMVKLNLRYPGQYFDDESNLHYNYRRTYDARTGRYTQPDPIGLDGGWNRFDYGKQNPLTFTDPSGLCPFCPAIGAAVGAVAGGYAAHASGGNVGVGAAVGALAGAVGNFPAATAGGAAAAGAAGGALGSFAGPLSNGNLPTPQEIAIGGMLGGAAGPLGPAGRPVFGSEIPGAAIGGSVTGLTDMVNSSENARRDNYKRIWPQCRR